MSRVTGSEAIASLGPPPPAPIPARLRAWNGGSVNAPDRIWTEPIIARLHRAYAIDGRRGVRAAFPGWEPVALSCALRRCGTRPLQGDPVPFDPDAFRNALRRMEASAFLERLRLLLLWGRNAARWADA